MDTKLNVALLLLTCEREDKTRRTVDSLLQHVDLSRFILLHGDDASVSNKNCKEAWRAGFKTVVRPTLRRGVCNMWESLIEKAAALGVDWIITQENDWEWCKPFPFDVLEQAMADPDIYYMRFFGRFKEANNTRPCGVKHSGRPGFIPQWTPYIDGWEKGEIHWGFPANATRIKEARFLTKGIRREDDSRKRSGQIKKLCIRPHDNFINHIGDLRTPGFKT